MKRIWNIFRFLIFSSVFSFLLASLFHFAYDFFGQGLIFSFFFPTNESVWEHLKLAFYPTIIVWLFLSNSLSGAISGSSYSTLISIFVVLFGYYGLKYGFKLEGLWVDLVLLFVGIFLGQCLGVLMKKKYPGKHLFFSLSHVLLWGLVFAFFTLHPPLEFPVFQPPVIAVRVVENVGKYVGGYCVM